MAKTWVRKWLRSRTADAKPPEPVRDVRDEVGPMYRIRDRED